jgi:hypothetical protein
MRALPWILGGGAAALAGYYWQRSRDGSDTNADGGKHADPSPSSGHRGDASAPAANGSTGSPAPAPERLPGRWVWPLGVLHQHVQEQLHGQLQDHLQDRFPEISDGFYSKRRSPSGQEVTHGGVDIMYRRKPGDPWKPGTPNGSPGWVMPDHRSALAASDGVVWSAANTPRGWTVVIDHAPRKLATYYTHLSSLLVTAKQPVSVGTPLGIIGADPLDAERIMHLLCAAAHNQ